MLSAELEKTIEVWPVVAGVIGVPHTEEECKRTPDNMSGALSLALHRYSDASGMYGRFTAALPPEGGSKVTDLCPMLNVLRERHFPLTT